MTPPKPQQPPILMLTGSKAPLIQRTSASDGRLAQRESTRFTREGSLVQSQHRPPSSSKIASGNKTVERCRSGRTGRSRKPLCLRGYRGFESHPLRHYLITKTIRGSRWGLFSFCFKGVWRWYPNFRDWRHTDFLSLNGFRLKPSEPPPIWFGRKNELFSMSCHLLTTPELSRVSPPAMQSETTPGGRGAVNLVAHLRMFGARQASGADNRLIIRTQRPSAPPMADQQQQRGHSAKVPVARAG